MVTIAHWNLKQNKSTHEYFSYYNYFIRAYFFAAAYEYTEAMQNAINIKKRCMVQPFLCLPVFMRRMLRLGR